MVRVVLEKWSELSLKSGPSCPVSLQRWYLHINILRIPNPLLNTYSKPLYIYVNSYFCLLYFYSKLSMYSSMTLLSLSLVLESWPIFGRRAENGPNHSLPRSFPLFVWYQVCLHYFKDIYIAPYKVCIYLFHKIKINRKIFKKNLEKILQKVI